MSASREVCLRGSASGGSAYPLVLTSSGSHCSSRYAPYWNAFLLYHNFKKCCKFQTSSSRRVPYENVHHDPQGAQCGEVYEDIDQVYDDVVC